MKNSYFLPLCAMALALTAQASDGPMGVERVARAVGAHYQSPAPSDSETRWVQVDLGASHNIEKVKLLPMVNWTPQSEGFPVRFRLEASDDPAFKTAMTIADHTGADYPDPIDAVAIFQATNVAGRYVRLTATQLRQKQLALTKLEVWSGGKDIAEGCPASDSAQGSLGQSVLTRPPRPQGEGVVTDNLRNVLPASLWRPVPYKISAPTNGVRLDDGLFKTAMQNNIAYLLNSFSNAELLRQFRERAGKPIAPGLRKPHDFWDVSLPGSSAGRFLMGAGTTLRWMEDPELHRRMDQLVEGIAECREPNGYLMAYAPDTIFTSERAAYTRSWVTHGLIEAGYAGNPKAFPLLRGYYNWFDTNSYLPELLRRGGQGVQGMIGNTRMYFTPLGKPEDIQVVQRYFQEDYWLDQLANREERAIWQYPYDHPHCYLLTSIEPYLDQYRATGSRRYLEAGLGGWELYHNNWENVGGSLAICEGDTFPPKSYYLHKNNGELCGNVFWSFFNQRLECLYPDQEKYVNEIEKSIYNVGLANQGGTNGIRYLAKLVGHKDRVAAENTCCEGQGTRFYGSLPEFIYSIANDGLYVNLFAASSIHWQQRGMALSAKMTTQFPFKPEVQVQLSTPQPIRSKIHVRVPAWAAREMPILVNGKKVAAGKPGTFAVLDRQWKDQDTISFALPMDFKLSLYEGADEFDGQSRYALEYGPILMAVVGNMDEHKGPQLPGQPQDFVQHLKAKSPLHFTIEGDPQHEYIPYWEVKEEVFTCYPIIGKPAIAAQSVGVNDLALASKGATVTSDSEYSKEPGCTAKAIDGVIASPQDFSNRWHSSLNSPHPHWIEVTLPQPAKIGTVVLHFADPAGRPTSFQGIMRVNGKDKVVFDVKDYYRSSFYRAQIPPVTSATFRLVIRSSANPAFQNAAQISEIELYPPE